MNILIIGGTRNIGFSLARHLYEAGHHLTLLNRGVTKDELPQEVARLRADRTDMNQLKRALGGRHFDVVIDTVLYKGIEAEAITQILKEQVDHYIFISTGQVYLVRKGVERPFTEDDYEGELLPQPEPNTYDYEEWLYGIGKRAAENTLHEAYESDGFPYTSLRLPMVNSERDGFKRLYGYILRIKDGGPILVPETPNYPVRNVYAGDVVNAVMRLIEAGKGKGRAYNISQDETLELPNFLNLLGDIIGVEPNIQFVERDLLRANGFLPDCSPFSDMWMSELDNERSKRELGMVYTPLREYLTRIVDHYEDNPPPKPTSYRRRQAEKHLLMSSN